VLPRTPAGTGAQLIEGISAPRRTEAVRAPVLRSSHGSLIRPDFFAGQVNRRRGMVRPMQQGRFPTQENIAMVVMLPSALAAHPATVSPSRAAPAELDHQFEGVLPTIRTGSPLHPHDCAVSRASCQEHDDAGALNLEARWPIRKCCHRFDR
jgi:hypothetical protein